MRSLILENSNRDSIIINDPVEAVKVEPNLNFDGKIKIFNYVIYLFSYFNIFYNRTLNCKLSYA